MRYRCTERDGRKGPPAGNKALAIAQTRHIARLRNAKRSRTKHPKPTHGARDRPKQPQPRAGRDRASGSGQQHASRRVHALYRHKAKTDHTPNKARPAAPADTTSHLRRRNSNPARQDKATAAAGAKRSNVSTQRKGARCPGRRQSRQPRRGRRGRTGQVAAERSTKNSAKALAMKEALVTAPAPAVKSPRTKSREWAARPRLPMLLTESG
jgi:hypothetical protein